MSTTKPVTFITAAALLAIGSVASGQSTTPTQADFDRCNQQAQASLSPASPSASPATATPRATAPAPGTSSAPAPGTSSAPAPGTSSAPAPTVTTPGPSSLPGATSSSDPTLRGMASAGLNDPGYQLAYRNCLAGK